MAMPPRLADLVNKMKTFRGVPATSAIKLQGFSRFFRFRHRIAGEFGGFPVDRGRKTQPSPANRTRPLPPIYLAPDH